MVQLDRWLLLTKVHFSILWGCSTVSLKRCKGIWAYIFTQTREWSAGKSDPTVITPLQNLLVSRLRPVGWVFSPDRKEGKNYMGGQRKRKCRGTELQAFHCDYKKGKISRLYLQMLQFITEVGMQQQNSKTWILSYNQEVWSLPNNIYTVVLGIWVAHCLLQTDTQTNYSTSLQSLLRHCQSQEVLKGYLKHNFKR